MEILKTQYHHSHRGGITGHYEMGPLCVLMSWYTYRTHSDVYRTIDWLWMNSHNTRKSQSRGCKVYWKSNQISSVNKNWIFRCGHINNYILWQKTQLNVGKKSMNQRVYLGTFKIFRLKSIILTQMVHLHSYSCSANMNPWWLPKRKSLEKHSSVALKVNCVSHFDYLHLH